MKKENTEISAINEQIDNTKNQIYDINKQLDVLEQKKRDLVKKKESLFIKCFELSARFKKGDEVSVVMSYNNNYIVKKGTIVGLDKYSYPKYYIYRVKYVNKVGNYSIASFGENYLYSIKDFDRLSQKSSDVLIKNVYRKQREKKNTELYNMSELYNMYWTK